MGQKRFGIGFVKMICHSCQKDPQIIDKIGFREECMHCGADLHCCLNCKFYDTSSYNDCKETSAERVLDKEKSNLCEYFQPRDGSSSSSESSTDSAKAALDALFKK